MESTARSWQRDCNPNEDMMSAEECGGSKFLGGAEMATCRRKAQKSKTATRILRPGESLQPKDMLSKKLPPMERFFASLFRSPPSDFVQANVSEEARARLIGDVCRRLGLDPPSQLKPLYKDTSTHFEARAALVMEESRHAVSESLSRIWNSRGQNACIRVTLESMQTRKEPGHVVFRFEKNTPFTPRELYDVRPGCVFEILPPSRSRAERTSLLACVVSNGREMDEHSRSLSLMVFSSFGNVPNSNGWQIRPVTNMISMIRQFEACTNGARRVPFLHALLGHKGSTHTRFESDSEEDIFAASDEGEKKEDSSDSEEDIFAASDEDEKKEDSTSDEDEKKEDVTDEDFFLPQLNPTQEKAAHAFLKSSPHSITLIQGPPGTGKTTLLTTVICRYLMQSKSLGVKRRLMVCAPTNKAVTVLAARYLDSIRHTKQDPYNAVMIGDQDKLLFESDDSTCPFQVQSIFAYTWIHGVAEECRSIRQALSSATFDVVSLLSRTHRLCTRIVNSLPRTSVVDSTLAFHVNNVRETVLNVTADGPAPHSQCWIEELASLANTVLALDPLSVVKELLESADVIFCTLASAGASVVRSTSSINDLIVDEAAASTEPELYIPFQLNPNRLLLVGDPMQLPATVLSRSAERLGLNRSLHERLMYELGWDRIMLDVQYRMKPEISLFPSRRFYGGKIANGENVMSPLYKNNAMLLNRQPYVFLQVSGMERQVFGGSYCNTAEAEAVLKLVQRLRALSGRTDWHSVERIRIITFYQAQVSLLTRMLSERGLGQIVVATVDSSQGCEADIVIVSFVRSIHGGRSKSAGFLSDDRRLNVAITRAKYQLICVGNAKGMQCMPNTSTLHSLSHDAHKRKSVIPDDTRGSKYSGNKNRKKNARKCGKHKSRKRRRDDRR